MCVNCGEGEERGMFMFFCLSNPLAMGCERDKSNIVSGKKVIYFDSRRKKDSPKSDFLCRLCKEVFTRVKVLSF